MTEVHWKHWCIQIPPIISWTWTLHKPIHCKSSLDLVESDDESLLSTCLVTQQTVPLGHHPPGSSRSLPIQTHPRPCTLQLSLACSGSLPNTLISVGPQAQYVSTPCTVGNLVSQNSDVIQKPSATWSAFSENLSLRLLVHREFQHPLCCFQQLQRYLLNTKYLSTCLLRRIRTPSCPLTVMTAPLTFS